jgi:hypothetical protein
MYTFKLLLSLCLCVASAAFGLRAEGAPAEKDIHFVRASIKGLGEKLEVTLYKIDAENSGGEAKEKGDRLRGYKILAEKKLDDPKEIAGVLKLLQESGSPVAANCFTPGMGFRIKSEKGLIEFVICLKCNWDYVYVDKEHVQISLTQETVKGLLKVYETHFGKVAE